ncbi:ribokinase [Fictibacillus enclensis]|uniref:Ribokinase n=1 Tax=Fictibacillus enclensis TaxID=1017270 RepID=A0A0V8J5N4_9BACL|nr:ribokinase [Fictibacillus enclensis]KSU82016.1 ribokinase [Fictibacillus enclensis]SCC29057.1 ribokinase [Fictibacillus enclensis]
MAPKITVVGSINMDLVTLSEKVPKMGETLLGQEFRTIPGGKGANQAVAAAKLGADVRMVGCVGDDVFGTELLEHLKKQGVDVSHVDQVSGSTGTATILVSEGDNSIIVVPAANHSVTPLLVEKKRDAIAGSDFLLVQLEIPLESVQKAVSIAKENGVKVILNPAPIEELSEELLQQTDYITPNEHELERLLQDRDQASIQDKIIVTKGSDGLTFYQNNEEVNLPSYSVEVKDTTGAGDSFNGGLAVGLSQGMSLQEACRYGNAVAALSTTKLGAQTGMPTKEEVEQFIAVNG